MQLLDVMGNEVGLPQHANSFMFTFLRRVDSTVLLMGHPPRSIIEQSLRTPKLPKLLVIEQEDMHDENPRRYDLWTTQDSLRTFDLGTPFDEALRQVLAPKQNSPGSP